MGKLREFEIRGFLGEASSNENPIKEQSLECFNFDLRQKTGDLVSRVVPTTYSTTLADADHRTKLSGVSWISGANFNIPDIGGGKDIVVNIYEATLNGETPDTLTAPIPNSLLCIFTDSQWNGSAWVDKNWDKSTAGRNWLNHTILTKIRAVNASTWKLELDFTDYKTLTGTIDPAASVDVVGVGTLFTTELVVGDRILVSTETRVVATITDNTHLTVTAAFTDNANDTAPKRLLNFDNWTVDNQSRNHDTAKVIKTYDVGSGQVGIEISKATHDWAAGDTILITKNYVPFTYIAGMGSGITGADVVYHKVLNDLRIGFGGQANRLGLSIGYRKKYYSIKGADFGSYSAAEIEALAKIDGLVLQPYNTIGSDISLVVTNKNVGTGSLAPGSYYFKLTGMLDNLDEQLVAEANITLGLPVTAGSFVVGVQYKITSVGTTDFTLIGASENTVGIEFTATGVGTGTGTADAGGDINVNPNIGLGAENKRFTKFKLYWSGGDNANELWYYLSEFVFSSADYTIKNFSLGQTGLLYVSDIANPELHTDNNAVINSGTDYNATTGWTFDADTVSIATATPTPPDGTYAIKILQSKLYSDPGFQPYHYAYYPIATLEDDTYYTVVFKLIGSIVGLSVAIGFDGEFSESFSFSTATTFQTITQKIKTGKGATKFFLKTNLGTTGWYIAFDTLSIIKTNTSTDIDSDTAIKTEGEISDLLGYVPTLNLIKSWDQAIVSNNRTFIINPYIDKRILNRIYFSPISGGGAPQYDTLIAVGYWPFENFDGNNVVGFALLPNYDFLLLKSNSVEWVDSRYGTSRTLNIKDGCVSRQSIAKYADGIGWAGNNDIHSFSGGNVKNLSEGTIREKYRELIAAELSGITASRDSLDAAYKIYLNCVNSAKTDVYLIEYTLTKRGFISRQRATNVLSYITSSAYGIDSGASGITVVNRWKSIEFDIDKLGEGIKHTNRFYVDGVWIYGVIGIPTNAGRFVTGTVYEITSVGSTDFTLIGASANTVGVQFTATGSGSGTGIAKTAPYTLTLSVYIDGALYQPAITVTFDDYGRFSQKLIPGANGCKVQLVLTGNDTIGGNIIVKSIGLLWNEVEVGVWR